MIALATSLYLVSTAAFAAIALVVGARLVLLSLRTGEHPERLLGLGVMLTAALGYGCMMIGVIGRQGAADPSAFGWTAITGLGWALHDLGVVCQLAFVVAVFRPDERWARVLACGMAALLWFSLAGFGATGGFRAGAVLSNWYWAGFLVIGSYQGWMALESFRYWGMMRRRTRLGLADPLVTNRFLLWGVAALCALAAIWTVNIPGFAGVALGSDQAPGLQAMSMLLAAVFGTTTVATYWFTFFPPGWYRERLAATA
jgi:hypothetical protein